MRTSFACVLSVSAVLLAGPAFAQTTAAKCDNPNALGVSRLVEIDTTGGPGFGFEHFKQHDFLRANEVLLTFDDGPWPGNTPAVLKALAEHCTKGTFFIIGQHASYHPELLRQIADAGHTIGTHTWSHKTLNRKSLTLEQAKAEIEKGISAVSLMLGRPAAPFFRFPTLQHSEALVSYLGERNVSMFSTDVDSFDFRTRKPEQMINTTMTKLNKTGKGIVLMHDFQHVTGEALPELLRQLKAGGFKIVHKRAKDSVKTLAEYDELVRKDAKLQRFSERPTANVVRTVE